MLIIQFHCNCQKIQYMQVCVILLLLCMQLFNIRYEVYMQILQQYVLCSFVSTTGFCKLASRVCGTLIIYRYGHHAGSPLRQLSLYQRFRAIISIIIIIIHWLVSPSQRTAINLDRHEPIYKTHHVCFILVLLWR